MKSQYPIYRGKEIVGEACIEKHGMFWHIKCRCRAGKTDPLRIVAAFGTNMLELGKYSADTEGQEVERWVSAKSLPSGDIQFSLEAWKQERFIPLTEALPFSELEKLSSARFENLAGQPGIWLLD